SKRDWSSDVCSSDLEDRLPDLVRSGAHVLDRDLHVHGGGVPQDRTQVVDLGTADRLREVAQTERAEAAPDEQDPGLLGVLDELDVADVAELVEVRPPHLQRAAERFGVQPLRRAGHVIRSVPPRSAARSAGPISSVVVSSGAVTTSTVSTIAHGASPVASEPIEVRMVYEVRTTRRISTSTQTSVASRPMTRRKSISS